ncbi:hypothetical protein [Pendulispora albinea]|uniref:Uncharacterized protein n=1 Tax=Pendulispora albinea TaxID=2741071 RepID=A0ABZ2M760_9BACT
MTVAGTSTFACADSGGDVQDIEHLSVAHDAVNAAAVDPCALHPWSSEHACSDGLRRAATNGPSTKPVKQWATTTCTKNCGPWSNRLRVDARGRLFGHFAYGLGGMGPAVFDQTTGEPTWLFSASAKAEANQMATYYPIGLPANVALGANDTAYACITPQDETTGDVSPPTITAFDVRPGRAPRKKWATTLPEPAFGPCEDFFVTADGLVVVGMPSDVAVLDTSGHVRFVKRYQHAFKVVTEKAGPLYVEVTREPEPPYGTAPAYLVGLDRTTGAELWSADIPRIDESILGAIRGGVLARYYSTGPRATSIFFQSSQGSRDWTIDVTGLLRPVAATTPTNVFLAGVHEQATLDLDTHSVSPPTTRDEPWYLETKRVVIDQRGNRYITRTEKVGMALEAFDPSGNLLWEMSPMSGANDFVLGKDGWMYVANRNEVVAYRGTP